MLDVFRKGPGLNNATDAYIHIRINRNVSLAIIASLLVHVLLLWWLSRQDLLNPHAKDAKPEPSIVVRLNPKAPPQAKKAEPPAETRRSPPAIPPHQEKKPKTQPPLLTRPDAPKAVLPAPEPVPTPPAPRAPAPPKQPPLDPAQFPDMASYLNAVRERRRLAGEDADRVNEEARAESEAQTAKRSAQQSGTNGVFQILSMNNRSAQIAFRGWKNEYSYSHREVYAVEAGADGNVERAVVRKMIEIIRRYYNGDFNWESHRLGRVVVLSARLQDNDGLEDFLLQDFFGARGVSAR